MFLLCFSSSAWVVSVFVWNRCFCNIFYSVSVVFIELFLRFCVSFFVFLNGSVWAGGVFQQLFFFVSFFCFPIGSVGAGHCWRQWRMAPSPWLPGVVRRGVGPCRTASVGRVGAGWVRCRSGCKTVSGAMGARDGCCGRGSRLGGSGVGRPMLRTSDRQLCPTWNQSPTI